MCCVALEFGSFCSARKCIPNGQMSLAEIAYKVLGKKIKKDERLSNRSLPYLSAEQIEYAAIDVWTSLAIYSHVKSRLEIGTRVTSRNCLPGTFVGYKPHGIRQTIARGKIVSERSNSDVVKILVTRLDVPGFVASLGTGISSNDQRSLDSFGPVPFELNILMKDLVIEAETEASSFSTTLEVASAQCRVNSHSTSSYTVPESEIDEAFGKIFDQNPDMVDKDSFKHGYRSFSNLRQEADPNISKLYTRVVKDMFHLMDMIKPYKRHTLYKEFTCRFSDCLFVLDEDDKKIVEDVLERNDMTWDVKMKYDRSWVFKRVRRRVPSPSELLPSLKSLFLSFGPLKCSKSARTLFDKLAWKQALSILKTVELGHASDPPGVQLYYKKCFSSLVFWSNAALSMLFQTLKVSHSDGINKRVVKKSFIKLLNLLKSTTTIGRIRRQLKKKTRQIHHATLENVINEFRARIVLPQAESTASPSLTDVSLNTSLQEVQILPQYTSRQQMVPNRFPLQAQNMPFTFRMPIPVFVPENPVRSSNALILPHSASSNTRVPPTILLSNVVRTSRKRTCKGCRANTCGGGNNKNLCTLSRCFKCQQRECVGLFVANKCDALTTKPTVYSFFLSTKEQADDSTCNIDASTKKRLELVSLSSLVAHWPLSLKPISIIWPWFKMLKAALCDI